MRKLPPLNSLKAFESTALYESFSKAALELGVTQGAVSKQIKLLEEYLGFRLFERIHQNLKITKDGKNYLKNISKALEMIEASTVSLKEKYDHNETLRINILPSLSSKWLIPMLEDFHKKYPYINTHIDIGDGKVDFERSKADIAIRVSRDPIEKKYHSVKIFNEELLPVYSGNLRELSPVNSLEDLKKHKLLKHTSRPDMWNEYLAALGYKGEKIKHNSGFEHFFMLIEAVLDNAGIALIPRFLIEKELKRKQLYIALETKFKSPYSYYFICEKASAEKRKVKLFKDWLIKS